MNNLNHNSLDTNDVSKDVYVARISLIGNILSTLGDALQTIGAGIELQQLENESVKESSQQTKSDELAFMQKQIDELTVKVKEMEGLKKDNFL